MQIPLDILQQCWFLAGPTACGKSATGLVLAQTGDMEIISLDSMALYRGMDVGTAKPTANDRSAVSHHLIDVIDPHQEFSVAEYVDAAETTCRDIVARGRKPLFVGGTGLYLRSLLRGVFEGPEADWAFRRSLEAEAAERDSGYLHGLLSERDPEAAAYLHPNDHRRIIRALEVLHVTGETLSSQQDHPPLPPEQRPHHVYWLNPPRDWLHEQINRRVESMIQRGLVAEVRRLLDADRPMSRTARQALGYKEIIEHLEGRQSLAEAVQQIQTRTRQFAKRQCTWFRNLEECRPIDMTGTETPGQLAERIASER